MAEHLPSEEMDAVAQRLVAATREISVDRS